MFLELGKAIGAPLEKKSKRAERGLLVSDFHRPACGAIAKGLHFVQ